MLSAVLVALITPPVLTALLMAAMRSQAPRKTFGQQCAEFVEMWPRWFIGLWFGSILFITLSQAWGPKTWFDWYFITLGTVGFVQLAGMWAIGWWLLRSK